MSTTEEVLKNLEDNIEKARKAREILATKQEARKKILFSNKRFPPDQEWKLKKLKDVTEEGDKKLKLYQEFFDKLQRGTPEQPGESQTSQDDTSEVSKEMNESLINDEVEKEPSVESDVLEDVSDLLASDSELENKDSRYYCSNCPASFERDDKMLFHQEECLRAGRRETSPAAAVKVVANQCPKCLTVINKKGRLIRHSRLCKGKKSAPTTPTPPEGRTEKKLSITNIDEAVVDNVRDAASLEERESKHGPDTPSSAQSHVPSQPPDEATRRGRGRPKKPPVDVSNVLGQITPTVNLKRVSSTSLRSSASSSSNPTSDSTTTSSQNSDESSENSGVNSRPKRSRKTVDKDL